MNRRVDGQEGQGYWQSEPGIEVQEERDVVRMKPLLSLTAQIFPN